VPPEPPKVVHLDQLESIPGPGTLTWHPVRFTLGVRAFGCNAYAAAEAGQDVVEPHTEQAEDPALAHQELYFVAAGRATFTIDGESYDAPTGTYVSIPDPASHRHAVAAEPATTVLSFGGPPTFEPSPWEWAFRAGPMIRSDPARAREILAEGLDAIPARLRCTTTSPASRPSKGTATRRLPSS
jgi:mannose-6-phosphate isomerase-like protein (cupin superfamily)